MDRRDFIKLAGATGLTLASPAISSKKAEAQEPYKGKFYVFVGASGGWDPTSFCDPKGFLTDPDAADTMNQFFAAADIGNAGNIAFAPGTAYQTFAEKHSAKMLVINGMDMQTNGHDSGRRHSASGKLDENFPAFGALVAAEYGEGLPMGFITNGFYDATGGQTARTRVGNIAAFERIAQPNVGRNGGGRRYHTEDTWQRIVDTQQSRLAALQSQQKLPKLQRSYGTLNLARAGDTILKQLVDFLPEDNQGSQLQRQARLAIAAYRAGACVSATLSVGGFDTHGNHDQNQLPSLDRLWEGVDFLVEEATRQGMDDRLVVIVGSDFGRTPFYNDGNGKDHWSVGSMVLLGPGINGNRTIGSTTYDHQIEAVDATSLTKSADGIRIQPGHVHIALRKLAGLDQSNLNSLFPLNVTEHLNLFG